MYEPAKKRRNGRVQQGRQLRPGQNQKNNTVNLLKTSKQIQKNSLRRGGYSSEVARQVNADIADEEPQVLSRQAKYNYKKKKR